MLLSSSRTSASPSSERDLRRRISRAAIIEIRTRRPVARLAKLSVGGRAHFLGTGEVEYSDGLGLPPEMVKEPRAATSLLCPIAEQLRGLIPVVYCDPDRRCRSAAVSAGPVLRRVCSKGLLFAIS